MNRYDYIVYKTTNLINGMIYIGYDSFNRSYYFGSGTYLYNSIYKVIKDYTENVLKKDFNPGKSGKTFFKRYSHIIPLFFKKEVLEYYTTKEEMLKGEVKWITYFNSIDKNIGYNITPGGIWGDTMTNHPNLEKIKQKIGNKLGKIVFKRDLYGTIIENYKSIKKAAKENNVHKANIIKCCNGKIKHCGGFIWTYDDSILILNYDVTKKIEDELYIFNKRYRIVYQYDLNYNFIKLYNSTRIAAKETNICGIRRCCDGKYKTAGNYIWSYVKI